MLRSIYGRLREEFGWKNREIDELSMGEVEQIGEHWRDEPPIGRLLRTYFGLEPGAVRTSAQLEPSAPREVTEEEWQRICAEEKAAAERFAGPGNPFL